MNVSKLAASAYLICMLSSAVAQNAVLQKTIIDSDRMELASKKDRNVFRFIGNVVISGTNLKARCDEMELIALREGAAPQKKDDADAAKTTNTAKTDEDDEGLIGQIGGIESLIAKGNVYIEQAGRTVEGGLAKIFPQRGYLEVTDKPKFTDSSGAVVTGKSIKLERGNRTAIVEPADDGTRARVTLPPMDDLGVDLEKLIDSEPSDKKSDDSVKKETNP